MIKFIAFVVVVFAMAYTVHRILEGKSQYKNNRLEGRECCNCRSLNVRPMRWWHIFGFKPYKCEACTLMDRQMRLNKK